MTDTTEQIEQTENGVKAAECPDTEVRFPWRKDKPSPGLKAVVILTEGVRGHLNQSRGVAGWLARRTGAEILELEVQVPSGVRRGTLHAAAARLLEGNRRKARDWLSQAEGENVIRKLGQWLMQRNIREGEPQSLLLLSAGTLPAFYNAALGYIWRCSCATIMTPSVIGTEPFDFAIVPEHDYPKAVSNVLTTVGAPNLIVREELGPPADALLAEFPPQGERRWGILLGGNNKNNRISPEWVQAQIGKIFREAERSNVDLYIATSRRTPPEAESMLKRLAANCPNVRFLLRASEDPSNPVPSILGACDEVFVTGDSVNMISEAATAGHRVVLMRPELAGTLLPHLQEGTALLVRAGLLPRRALWGIPRFNQTIYSFEKMGLLVEFKQWLKTRRRGDHSPLAYGGDAPGTDEDGFNEARRAADWILEHLGDVQRPWEDDPDGR